MIKQKIIWSILFAAGLFMLFAGSSLAAVSADEARQLGTTLTEFGAIKAGNEDGSIPAYTGGLKMDRGKGQSYADPFKGEKPLYTIDAKNVAKYASQLTEGTKALIKRFPDTYKVHVYPTHRSVWYPSWVIQNTLKNATTAKLSGEIIGDGVSGPDEGGFPFAGIPFPIPKTGCEVMWNYKIHVSQPAIYSYNSAWLVDTAGRVSSLPDVVQYHLYPWYEQSKYIRSKGFDAVFGFSSLLTSPPSSAGTYFLNFYLPKGEGGGQQVWFYTPGQRRVRKAPEFAYDVPVASYGGVFFWDEVFGFVGRLDRFDYKLIGKKEIILPYNQYKISNQLQPNEFLGPKHLEPSAVRWEKHRVWVVDSTRKAGARHAYSRRTFYIDEDSWALLASESYDNAGSLWRYAMPITWPIYDMGGIGATGWTTTDIIKGNYITINAGYAMPGHFVRCYSETKDLNIPLTPQAVASSLVR